MKSTLEICQDLIRFESITPSDAGTQQYIAQLLQEMGFRVQHFNKNRVANLYAQFGEGKPLFVFAGHTDVVPTGELSTWSVPPFAGVIQDHRLFGRGVADMKGSLAAMLTATESFLQEVPTPSAAIGFLLTSGEEGDDYLDGTPYVLEQLKQAGVQIDYCVLGEPSSHLQTGDTLRVGRRGSLSATLTIFGKQGHVAYPNLADNPIPRFAEIITALTTKKWDNGNEFFPATGFQITSLLAGTGAGNVIPGQASLQFNFRYSTENSAEQLKQTTETIIRSITSEFNIEWHHSGNPFLTRPGALIHACHNAIEDCMDFKPKNDTGGGTSDGRFISPHGIDVVECGPCNATIHQVDEAIELKELTNLHRIYLGILQRICV